VKTSGRLLVLRVRPAVLFLLGLYAAIGFAQAGAATSAWLLARAFLVVAGFLVFSVAANDLADEAVDRVNLPADEGRSLVSGRQTRHRLLVTATAAATLTLVASLTLGWRGFAVTAIGLAISAGYSLPPTRWSGRGAVAALVLPACYVAVPYLLGIFSIRPRLDWPDLALLAGLYLGFIGRILLKDFRDVRGDALFGKRTFLVRHGRASTCRTSAVFWTVGSVLLMVTVRQPSPTLIAAWSICLAVSIHLLRLLSDDRGPRRDEALISALAIVGRGVMVMLFAHLSMTDARWSTLASSAVLAALLLVTLGQAREMVVFGPRFVPWRSANEHRPAPAAEH